MLPTVKGTNDKVRLTLPKPNTQNHQDRQDLVKFRQVAEDSVGEKPIIKRKKYTTILMISMQKFQRICIKCIH